MGTDFNGGEINTSVTEVDSPALPLHSLPGFVLCRRSEARAHGLDVNGSL